MPALIGQIATHTATLRDGTSLSVAWPDVVGAYDREDVELSLWRSDSEAQLYYHRKLTTGSAQPKLPWVRILAVAVGAGLICWLVPYTWLMVLAIVAAVVIIALMLFSSMRRFEPIQEGVGSPKLVVETLETDAADARDLVTLYLNSTREHRPQIVATMRSRIADAQ